MTNSNESMTNSNESMTTTDACFIELNALGYRISGALNIMIEHAEKLPMLQVEASSSKTIHKDKFLVKSMWEHLILNLYKFLEIHDSVLGKILKDNDALDLEKCLEPSWNEVKGLQEKISKYRHMIAHSKSLANNYLSFMEIDEDYYETQTKIIIASQAAVFYISGVFENLKFLYDNSRISFNHKIKKVKEWHPRDEVSDAKKEIEKILEKTNEELFKNGFEKTHYMKYN